MNSPAAPSKVPGAHGSKIDAVRLGQKEPAGARHGDTAGLATKKTAGEIIALPMIDVRPARRNPSALSVKPPKLKFFKLSGSVSERLKSVETAPAGVTLRSLGPESSTKKIVPFELTRGANGTMPAPRPTPSIIPPAAPPATVDTAPAGLMARSSLLLASATYTMPVTGDTARSI
jgi:hypothetical protein